MKQNLCSNFFSLNLYILNYFYHFQPFLYYKNLARINLGISVSLVSVASVNKSNMIVLSPHKNALWLNPVIQNAIKVPINYCGHWDLSFYRWLILVILLAMDWKTKFRTHSVSFIKINFIRQTRAKGNSLNKGEGKA